jgi:WD40 repeat protein
MEGHKSWVNAVAFDPAGKTLISGSSDGTVKVWDVATGECRQTVVASKAEVRSIAISSDGAIVAAGLRYGTIKTWSTADWADRAPAATGLAGDVWSLAFTADGRLLSGSGDWNQPGVVTFWDVLRGRQLEQWRHTGEVLAIAFSPGTRHVAAAGGDRTVTVWAELPTVDKP